MEIASEPTRGEVEEALSLDESGKIHAPTIPAPAEGGKGAFVACLWRVCGGRLLLSSYDLLWASDPSETEVGEGVFEV